MQQEQLGMHDGNTNANEEQNKEDLNFERVHLQGTPFDKISYAPKGKAKWFIVFADVRMTDDEDSESLKTPEDILKENMWNVVYRMAGAIQFKVAQEAVKQVQTSNE